MHELTVGTLFWARISFFRKFWFRISGQENCLFFKAKLTRTWSNSIIVKKHLNTYWLLFSKSFLGLITFLLIRSTIRSLLTRNKNYSYFSFWMVTHVIGFRTLLLCETSFTFDFNRRHNRCFATSFDLAMLFFFTWRFGELFLRNHSTFKEWSRKHSCSDISIMVNDSWILVEQNVFIFDWFTAIFLGLLDQRGSTYLEWWCYFRFQILTII